MSSGQIPGRVARVTISGAGVLEFVTEDGLLRCPAIGIVMGAEDDPDKLEFVAAFTWEELLQALKAIRESAKDLDEIEKAKENFNFLKPSTN